MPKTEGMRVELVVSDPPDCPVAEAADRQGATGRSVARTRGSPVTEDAVLEGVEEAPNDADTVYEDDTSAVYRFERDDGNCVCETIEGYACPVVDARVRGGNLHVVFHVRDKERLRNVVDGLRETYESVSLRRVTKDDEDDGLVYADDLTERQREALETAHRMGYFDHPKGANATEVADAMGIAASTFTEHLSAAQRKVLGALLD